VAEEAVVGGYSGGVEAATVGRQAVMTVAVATLAAAVKWPGGMVAAAGNLRQEGADYHRHRPLQLMTHIQKIPIFNRKSHPRTRSKGTRGYYSSHSSSPPQSDPSEKITRTLL